MTVRLMNTPKSLEIEITTHCNLRCRHCGHFTSPGDVNKDLPAEEWLKFFEELNLCAVMDITLSGGDPFYRKDLKELIEGIARNRMRFSILSNGTLITDDMASFLTKTRRCNHVQVSIDGSTPEIHDSLRGKGTFLKAIQGIKFLKKYSVPVAVRVTIHKRNYQDLEQITKLLLEEIGLPGFSTNSASPYGLCRENAGYLRLSIEEHFLAMETLLKLNKKYNNRISASAGPLANARHWIKMEGARCNGKESLPGRGFLVSCGGVLNKLGIRADGVIVPCCIMSHIELGRINQNGLKEIWQNHPELKRLRERRNVPLSEFEFCQGCGYINYCAGGCPALAYTITGSDFHPSPDSCLKRYLEEGGMLPDKESLVCQPLMS